MYEQIADELLQILNSKNLDDEALVAIMSDVLLNIGLSKTGANISSLDEVLPFISEYKQQHGETIPGAFIASGLLMQTWLLPKDD